MVLLSIYNEAWPPERVEFLLAHYQRDMSTAEIARALGTTESAVSNKAQALRRRGYPLPPPGWRHNAWTDQEDERLYALRGAVLDTELYTLFPGRTPTAIEERAKYIGALKELNRVAKATVSRDIYMSEVA